MAQIHEDGVRTPTPRAWVALIAATRLEVEPLLAVWGATDCGEVPDGDAVSGTGDSRGAGETPASQTASTAECVVLEVVHRRWHVFAAIPGARAGDTGMGAVVVETGYDKTNTAQALTSLLERAEAGRLPASAGSGWESKPRLVLQFGIAGAYPRSGLNVGDVVVATDEVYADTGASTPGGWLSTECFGIPLVTVAGRPSWNRFVLDRAISGRAARRLRWREPGTGDRPADVTRVEAGPCLTLSCVTGTEEEADNLWRRWGALAESMEGAAAAHICMLYGLPLLEVRAISNLVGDRDREAWDVPGAAARAARAAAYLLTQLEEIFPPASGAFGQSAPPKSGVLAESDNQ